MRNLLTKLQTLRESDRATGELIAIGKDAIPLLEEFLLLSKPSTIFQPRMNAVTALAQIAIAHPDLSEEIKGILLAYLRSPVKSEDPAIRFAEEAVRNTAVEELARWPDPSVVEIVMEMIREHPLAGVCRAAGHLRLTKAIPFLIAALSDDVARPAAMEALSTMLVEAEPLLIRTILDGCSCGPEEGEPAREQRARAAASLLATANLPKEYAAVLAPALDCGDPEIASGVARALLGAGSGDPHHIAEELMRLLPQAPWFIRDDMRESLEKCGLNAMEALEAEIRARPPSDMLLPMLVNIRRRILDRAS